MRMIFTILLFLLFGSCRKVVRISEATNTTSLNCFTNRTSYQLFYGYSCEPRADPSLKYPFWLNEGDDDDQICGYPGFGFTCTNVSLPDWGSRVLPTFNISNGKYYVTETDTTTEIRSSQSFQIVNAESSNMCSRPRQNFTLDDDPRSLTLSSAAAKLSIFYNCSVAPPPGSYNETAHRNILPSGLGNCSDYNPRFPSYFFSDGEIHDDRVKRRLQPLLSNWSSYTAPQYCDEIVTLPVQKWSYSSRFDKLLSKSFLVVIGGPSPSLTQECIDCEDSGGLCIYSNQKKSFLSCSCPPGKHLDGSTGFCDPDSGLPRKIILGIGVSAGVGGLIILILLSYVYHKIQRKKREAASNTSNVELFLEKYGCHSLQRYRYSQIKKITNSFAAKLGQGGFGTVYKGTLDDGRYVAVKVLVSDPTKKSSGEDFMNEVATIGRTNHVNVVALVGFCSSGTRRALVYEFMANGSLEKFIYTKSQTDADADADASVAAGTTVKEKKHPLGWEQLYQISLGIARGLEYLHRGCNTRILHFDIKPHNILLDETFCPKISDFGLAKLCPTRDSIVSMLTGGRGTTGYVAPEFFCRNLGGVSHKSDVYSYGMMVFEIVGGRKNIDPFVDNTSQVYFPQWIYNRLQEQNDKIGDLLKFQDVVEEEMARKMIIVGLWCIQTNPVERPSMGNVVDMLEGNIDNLQRPPKPFVDSSSSSFPPPKSRG